MRNALILAVFLLAACSPSTPEPVMTDPARQHHSINYIEFPLQDVDATKAFYGRVFGWSFIDYGPDYIAITGATVDGGFNREASASAAGVGVLVVLYSDNLEATVQAVRDAGGTILREPYGFPGGRRFHFVDPNGTEVAVWTE